MAQTLPPASDIPQPLPRSKRGRSHIPRTARPRLQALDIAWIVVLALIFGALAYHQFHAITLNCALVGLTIPITYLIGWRIAGRPCGVIAALLTASSFTYVLEAGLATTSGCLFVLLSLSALFFSAAEIPIAACALAGLASVARPDGILLGLLLLAVCSIRTPSQSKLCAPLFFLLGLGGWLIRIYAAHQAFPLPVFQLEHWPLSWAYRPATLFLLWFLVPFCADLSDTLRGPRWIILLLWGAVYSLLASFVHFAGEADTALALIPVLLIAVAGGVSRLLPTIAGDNPAGRYVFATLAVVSLLSLRAQGEWPEQLVARPEATLAPVTVPLAPVTVITPAIHAPRKAQPVPLAARPQAIPLFTMHNGKMIKRSKWAIQWDKTHPQGGQP